jgi:hypothetical protein
MTVRFALVPRALSATLLLASLCLAPRAAHADSVTAEALFQSGRAALDKGDAKVACDRFEESYRLEPKPGTALNLGNCREQLGQVASAWQRFQEAAQTLPADDSRQAIAKERAAALATKVPKLGLRLPEDAQGWVVLRDGAELGSASLNLALPVDPGSHQIEVRAPGHAPWHTSVDLALGEQREVALMAGKPNAAISGAQGPSAHSSTSSRKTVGWVLGGVGVAGVATSLITGAMVISKSSTVDSECADKRCSQSGLDAADSGRSLSTVSTIAAVVGVASLGVGIYFLVSDDGDKRAATPVLRRSAGQTRFGVVSTPGGASLQLRSSF